MLNQKEKLVKLLVKKGSNPKQAFQMVEKYFDYVQNRYSAASNSYKCDVIITLNSYE